MKLFLKSFRGATIPFEINFNQKDNNLSIIYGENGSGKTTISDAFDLLFRQNAGSLNEKSIDGKNKISSLVSNNGKPGDLEVTWEEQDQKMRAVIKGVKPIITGSTPSNLKTLRRIEVSKLIEDTPANRFKRIQNFVSLPAVENEEARLADFIKNQQAILGGQLQAAMKVEDEIEEFYQSENEYSTPKPELDVWLSEISNYNGSLVGENKEILSELHENLSDFEENLDVFEVVLNDLSEKTKAERTAQASLIQATKDSTEDYASALDILKQAQLFFRKHSPAECPVCENAIDPLQVTGSVDFKLEQLQTLTELANQLKSASNSKQQTKDSLGRLEKNIIEQLGLIARSYLAVIELGGFNLKKIPALITESIELESLNIDWLTDCKEIIPKLDAIYNQTANILNDHNTKSDQKRRLKAILIRKNDAKDEHTFLQLSIEKAVSILKSLQDSRVQHANRTLDSISGDFADLYSTIHPNEDLENIRLYLNPDKKGSAILDGSLLGKEEVSPVACLSESHLDTLGLCLFLALEKKENSENTILYLDDAIASVDEVHLERLYQLIVDQSVHFKHVILTTHYRPLRYKYKWGILNQGKVEFLELGKWHLNTGITFAKTPSSETDILKKYIAEANDPSTIASKSGIILEYIFDFLTGIYNSKLPRSPGAEQRWTLDNYRGGLSKIIKHLKVEHVDSDQQVIKTVQLVDLINDVFSLLQVRNCIGCHYKELTGHFDELSEALKLGNTTLALVEALCDDDGSTPQYRNSGSYWANTRKNATRRLYPLLTPQ